MITKYLYIVGAALIGLLIILILGYKVVMYSKDISELKQDKKDLQEEVKRKDNDIVNLKKDKAELATKYQGLSDERATQKPKVVTVYKTIEAEVGKCDNDPIGDQYVNGLREILSSK